MDLFFSFPLRCVRNLLHVCPNFKPSRDGTLTYSHTLVRNPPVRERAVSNKRKKGPKVVEQPCEDDDAGGIPFFCPFAYVFALRCVHGLVYGNGMLRA
jgi:hypothetical protein